jgi:hypothetical protein
MPAGGRAFVSAGNLTVALLRNDYRSVSAPSTWAHQGPGRNYSRPQDYVFRRYDRVFVESVFMNANGERWALARRAGNPNNPFVFIYASRLVEAHLMPPQQPIGGSFRINDAGLTFSRHFPPRPRPFATLTNITIHHTGGYGTLSGYHRQHGAIPGQGRDDQQWGGIGYHFLIYRNGQIWRGRPLTDIGAHVGGRNTPAIGIALIGDFHNGTQVPTQQQMNSLIWLIGDVERQTGRTLNLLGHHDSCPGRRFPWAEVSRGTGRPTPATLNLTSGAIINSMSFTAQPFAEIVLPYDTPDYVPNGTGLVTVVPNDWAWGDVIVSHEPLDFVWAGTEVRIEALANTWDGNFEFVRWEVLEGDAVLTNANSPNTSFIMPAVQNVFIQAIFQPHEGNSFISAVVNNENWGSVWQSHDVQMPGNYIALQAWANYGDGAFEFSHWEVLEGDVSLSDLISDYVYFLVPEGNVSIRAVFRQITNPVSTNVSMNNDDWGWTSASPSITSPNTEVIISAIPRYGMQFSHWEIVSGNPVISDITSSEAIFIMPDGDVHFRAVFQTPANTAMINVESSNENAGDAWASNFTASLGTQVSLYAIPFIDMEFAVWEVMEGNVVINNPNSPDTFFTMQSSNVSVRAVFRESTPTQTVPIPGDVNGDGQVTDADVSLLRMFLAGHPVDICLIAADVNGDGQVTDADVSLIRMYLAGHPVELRRYEPATAIASTDFGIGSGIPLSSPFGIGLPNPTTIITSDMRSEYVDVVTRLDENTSNVHKRRRHVILSILSASMSTYSRFYDR